MRPTVALAAAVAFLVVGCGASTSPGDGAAPNDPGSPVGGAVPRAGEYLSVPASTFPLTADTVVRLTVEQDTLSLSAGCNTLGGSWRLDGDRLVVDGVMSTMMGCAEDLADQDQRLTALLESRPVVGASSDGFTLVAADGATLVFVERAIADPDRALEGTRWVLEAIASSSAVSSAVGFETVELVLGGGEATVTTGCSTGRAPAAVTQTSVDLGPLELLPTTAECEPGIRDAEAALVAVFGGTATAEVRADRLELRRGDVGLMFVEA